MVIPYNCIFAYVIVSSLSVFLNLYQSEFKSIRLGLSRRITGILFLDCSFFEESGAETKDTRMTSLREVVDSDIYICILGNRFSVITQADFRKAI